MQAAMVTYEAVESEASNYSTPSSLQTDRKYTSSEGYTPITAQSPEDIKRKRNRLAQRKHRERKKANSEQDQFDVTTSQQLQDVASTSSVERLPQSLSARGSSSPRFQERSGETRENMDLKESYFDGLPSGNFLRRFLPQRSQDSNFNPKTDIENSYDDLSYLECPSLVENASTFNVGVQKNHNTPAYSHDTLNMSWPGDGTKATPPTYTNDYIGYPTTPQFSHPSSTEYPQGNFTDYRTISLHQNGVHSRGHQSLLSPNTHSSIHDPRRHHNVNHPLASEDKYVLWLETLTHPEQHGIDTELWHSFLGTIPQWNSQKRTEQSRLPDANINIQNQLVSVQNFVRDLGFDDIEELISVYYNSPLYKEKMEGSGLSQSRNYLRDETA